MTKTDSASVRRSLRWSEARVIDAVLIVAGVTAVAFGVAAGFGRPAGWAIPALALSVALAEMAVVHFNVGRERWTVSCTDALLSMAFVLAPGSWIALALPMGVAVAQLVRHQAPQKTVFNVAQYAAAAAAGAYAAHLAADFGLPRLSVAAVAMTAFWLTNTPLVATAVAVTSHRRLRSLLASSAPLTLVHTAASASVGLLAGWLVLTAPAGLLGLLVPVALLWSSFDQTSRRSAEARLFAELARGQEQASGGSVDGSAQVVLTAAARLFGGADVEMLVFAADGLARYVGDETAVPVHQRVAVEALDATWVADVLAQGVITGTDEGRPVCGLRVGPASRPLALLLARRDVGSGLFTRRDVRLAGVLVGQAEAWLSVADLAASRDAALDRAQAAGETARVLGNLGAHTTPALAVLRDSANRLARLAQSPNGTTSVDGIVEELHAVELAVASLLGAVAMAADGDLAVETVVVPDPAPARPRATDWTSTGVLG